LHPPTSQKQPRGFLGQALVDTDGTIAPTFGACKGGMEVQFVSH
jgi:hypothetical protein